MGEVEKTCENCEYELEDTEGTHCRHCIHNAEEKFKQKAYYEKNIECIDDVIERLLYKANNIKAKLEPSYFTECIEYLKSIIPCYLGSPCEYQTEDVNYNHGWVACSERLPKYTDEYNVTVDVASEMGCYRKVTTLRFENIKGTMPIWIIPKGEVYRIIAWRPLPSPYETEQMKEE